MNENFFLTFSSQHTTKHCFGLIVKSSWFCVFVCFFFQIFGVRDITMVFVESICRVKTLSLSGKIMYCFADYFIVQWQQLQTIFPKSIYLGRLV